MKIKLFITAIASTIISILYAMLGRSKLKQKEQEIKAQEEKIKADEFIKNEERKTEVIKSDSSSISDDELDGLYNNKNWYRD